MGRLDLLNHCFYMEDFNLTKARELYDEIILDNKQIISSKIERALSIEASSYDDFYNYLNKFIGRSA